MNINSINSDLDFLDDIRFDTTIIIFGLGKGSYIDEMKSKICPKNKIYIFEPKYSDYKKGIKENKNENIFLISFKDDIETYLYTIITVKNLFNFKIQIYNNYDELYPKEYDKFIKIAEFIYYQCNTSLSTDDTFKQLNFNNTLSNLDYINESYCFDNHINKYKNIPAIIVSAGPSLDKNIKELLEYKDKLDKFIIIAGNRTIGPLTKNNITPDIIVSVDPQDITYQMMKDNLNSDAILAFCLETNKKIVKYYNGKKMYFSQGDINNIQGLENTVTIKCGGSVVHTSTDLAFLLGCNPIIFIGQDFGYPENKGHALVASIDVDAKIDIDKCIKAKDVYGREIYTTGILDLYRRNLEDLIKLYHLISDIKFINCSYGVNIEGTEWNELKKELLKYGNNVVELELEENNLIINSKEIKEELLNYIENSIVACRESKAICDKIIENPIQENIIYFPNVLKCIDDFVKNPLSKYFEGYMNCFLVYIKESLFKMTAKEFPVLTGDIIYQSKIFRKYMSELEELQTNLKNIIKKYIT